MIDVTVVVVRRVTTTDWTAENFISPQFTAEPPKGHIILQKASRFTYFCKNTEKKTSDILPIFLHFTADRLIIDAVDIKYLYLWFRLL